MTQASICATERDHEGAMPESLSTSACDSDTKAISARAFLKEYGRAPLFHVPFEASKTDSSEEFQVEPNDVFFSHDEVKRELIRMYSPFLRKYKPMRNLPGFLRDKDKSLGLLSTFAACSLLAKNKCDVGKPVTVVSYPRTFYNNPVHSLVPNTLNFPQSPLLVDQHYPKRFQCAFAVMQAEESKGRANTAQLCARLHTDVYRSQESIHNHVRGFLCWYGTGTGKSITIGLILHEFFGFADKYVWAFAHEGVGGKESACFSGSTKSPCNEFFWQLRHAHSSFHPFVAEALNYFNKDDAKISHSTYASIDAKNKPEMTQAVKDNMVQIREYLRNELKLYLFFLAIGKQSSEHQGLLWKVNEAIESSSDDVIAGAVISACDKFRSAYCLDHQKAVEFMKDGKYEDCIIIADEYHMLRKPEPFANAKIFMAESDAETRPKQDPAAYKRPLFEELLPALRGAKEGDNPCLIALSATPILGVEPEKPVSLLEYIQEVETLWKSQLSMFYNDTVKDQSLEQLSSRAVSHWNSYWGCVGDNPSVARYISPNNSKDITNEVLQGRFPEDCAVYMNHTVGTYMSSIHPDLDPNSVEDNFLMKQYSKYVQEKGLDGKLIHSKMTGNGPSELFSKAEDKVTKWFRDEIKNLKSTQKPRLRVNDAYMARLYVDHLRVDNNDDKHFVYLPFLLNQGKTEFQQRDTLFARVIARAMAEKLKLGNAKIEHDGKFAWVALKDGDKPIAFFGLSPKSWAPVYGNTYKDAPWLVVFEKSKTGYTAGAVRAAHFFHLPSQTDEFSQLMGRVPRYKSHDELKPEERTCKVYVYRLRFDEDPVIDFLCGKRLYEAQQDAINNLNGKKITATTQISVREEQLQKTRETLKGIGLNAGGCDISDMAVLFGARISDVENENEEDTNSEEEEENISQIFSNVKNTLLTYIRDVKHMRKVLGMKAMMHKSFNEGSANKPMREATAESVAVAPSTPNTSANQPLPSTSEETSSIEVDGGADPKVADIQKKIRELSTLFAQTLAASDLNCTITPEKSVVDDIEPIRLVSATTRAASIEVTVEVSECFEGWGEVEAKQSGFFQADTLGERAAKFKAYFDEIVTGKASVTWSELEPSTDKKVVTRGFPPVKHILSAKTITATVTPNTGAFTSKAMDESQKEIAAFLNSVWASKIDSAPNKKEFETRAAKWDEDANSAYVDIAGHIANVGTYARRAWDKSNLLSIPEIAHVQRDLCATALVESRVAASAIDAEVNRTIREAYSNVAET